MAVRIAGEALNACSGCEISLLDMGERFITLMETLRIVHLPLLMDSKHSGITGRDQSFDIPEADIGLVSGSIKTHDHFHLARAMREACSTVVALGTCAGHGGIPAMANAYDNQEIKQCFLSTISTDEGSLFPATQVPALMDTCRAVDEIIRVDHYLPGCPPHPDHIFGLLTALAKGQHYDLPTKSVCSNCPALRNGKGEVLRLSRPLDVPAKAPSGTGESRDGLLCFIEQGFLCMGPVTIDGCGGNTSLARCIEAGVPCRGCFGPLPYPGDQRLAMLNALVSNGIDLDSLPETRSLLRFSGSHGHLTPPFGKKDIKTDVS